MLNNKRLASIQDYWCPYCKLHKENRGTDCSIRQAVIVKREPAAMQNMDKFFDENGRCKYFKKK